MQRLLFLWCLSVFSVCSCLCVYIRAVSHKACLQPTGLNTLRITIQDSCNNGLSAGSQHPTGRNETYRISVDCCRLHQASQGEKGEEAKGGLPGRSTSLAEETSPQTTTPEHIPLQGQVHHTQGGRYGISDFVQQIGTAAVYIPPDANISSRLSA